MTDWQPFTEATLTLPSDGKVTGHARVVFYGEGKAGILTESGCASVAYRGESWHVNTRWSRNTDGSWTHNPEDWAGGHVSSSSRMFNRDTPRTYRAAIIDALGAALASLWTPELDMAGLRSSVAQDLHRYERDRADTAAKLAEIDAKIEAAKTRLHTAALASLTDSDV